MAHDPFIADFFSEAGRMVQFCPMCDAEFNPVMARVLEEWPSGSLMLVECRQCKSALLAVMAQTSQGSSSFGFLTDLSADDYVRLSGATPISVDDVIDMHVRLEKGITFSKELTKTK